MHVGVIHRISDPEALEQAEQKALEGGLREGLSFPVHAATPDDSTVVCIWEAPSVDAVRDVVESTGGEYSENEYHEVELEQPSLGGRLRARGTVGARARAETSCEVGVLLDPSSPTEPSACSAHALLSRPN
jgi:hypothetical protein